MGKPGKVTPPQWDESQELEMLDFEKKAFRYKMLKEQIDVMEPERKQLAEELETIMTAANVNQVMFQGVVCSRRNGGQPSRIDATLLLEAGVDADVIARATVPGGKYTYFEMRDPAKQKDNRKGKGTGEDDE